jgi:hypothetical protein
VSVIRVSVDIFSGAKHFRAAVWAETIKQALNLTGIHYPGCEARVVLPIDPETFFAGSTAPAAEMIVLGASQEKAG